MIGFFSKLRNNNKGFTLVELMVVVVILGILVAIAVPIYNVTTDNAKKSAHNTNVRSLQAAASLYIADCSNKDTDPVFTSWADGTAGGTWTKYMAQWPKTPYAVGGVEKSKPYKVEFNSETGIITVTPAMEE
ncbi:prepilin-type N-terminal cleavage/methylation domain-containing protein [Anaerobacterium chartisolvens]|uniref:Prepilin-type N-terminal cleavage/methylation domain-containing protein n=1 Tax=Anaerobacterium chartisolvens TaxID=1297424 RepID=A0A369AXB6_9FIRM|nr:prepilin-type N-terminal cleavage/methylation domain-containing protein [Anaerobacterium chartisolvens]RCX13803.1 prepilin-type N-terminal cleavage/methylation domain-containing protein [Anaerobacterium chartisolvens]